MAAVFLSLPNVLSSTIATREGYHRRPGSVTTNVHPVNMPRAQFVSPLRSRSLSIRAAVESTATGEEEEEKEDEAMGIAALHQFVNLNLGSWNGYFYQFDALGNITQRIRTKLCVTSYGEEELVSLLQTLKIKQPPSKTSFAEQDEGPEWEEYKLRETNMFTVDRQQQKKRHFLSDTNQQKCWTEYCAQECLEKMIPGKNLPSFILRRMCKYTFEFHSLNPMNLKVPSRRPSIVCENCLYSIERESRMRAFHVMDPRGLIDMIGVFHEKKESEMTSSDVYEILEETNEDRINALLGRWSGHSVTKRSGVYGATIAEADLDILLEMDKNGRLIQDISSTSGGGTNVHLTGTVSGGLVRFDGGFQMTLLPGGMYLASPTSVGKSVAQSQSFLLEFCWMESPGKRRRLVRTYDVEGLAVSTTYVNETKL